MKKFTLLLALIYLSLISCSSEDNNFLNETSKSKISSVLNEKNSETQKIMYNMLNKYEKSEIWNDKIESLIKNEKLTNAQLNLLYELKEKFTVNVFNEEIVNDEREIFKTIFVKQFLKKSINVFSEEFIITNFYKIPTAFSRTIFIDEDYKATCSCNIGSIYSCGGATSPCRSTSICRTSHTGCGFGTMFECNGNCYVY